ncbi:MAG TPA: hypothetical protein EYG98_04335 [Sulfurovum sp.]|nr:hypothetical protein [Sulfurovum sp.]
MSIISTDFKFFIEYDSNPFILFSSKGAVLYLNKSAELLMGIHTERKIFDIALSHAPQSFGHKNTLLELTLGSFEFHSINVLYNNDDEIGIHLYTRPRAKIAHQAKLEGYSQTDINLLLQANIELFNISYNGELKLLADYELPEMQIHQNRFSMLLRKTFEQFKDSKILNINLKLKIGAVIVVGGRKYPIAILELKSQHRETSTDANIQELASNIYIDSHFEEHSITLEIPAIS